MEKTGGGSDATPRKRVSNCRAIWIGRLWVRLPYLLLGYGGVFVVLIALVDRCTACSFHTPYSLLAIWFVILLICQIPANIWWAYSARKWRAWAFERTADPGGLQAAAIEAGFAVEHSSLLARILTHPIFWSRKDRARYEELLRERASSEGGAP